MDANKMDANKIDDKNGCHQMDAKQMMPNN